MILFFMCQKYLNKTIKILWNYIFRSLWKYRVLDSFYILYRYIHIFLSALTWMFADENSCCDFTNSFMFQCVIIPVNDILNIGEINIKQMFS